MATTLNDLLASFSGTTPLLPLPDFVLFPQTVQPFQIFEPRYLELMKDCLAGERMVTIPLLKEDTSGQAAMPAFYSIATMGYIKDAQSAEDDKLNILVTGLVKVRVEEVDSDRPYRRGAVTPVADFDQVSDAEHRRQSILHRFQSMMDTIQAAGDLEALSDPDIPLQMLCHVIASALPIPAQEKQKMLELQSLELRIDILLNFMESGLLSMGALGPLELLLPTHPWWN